MIFSSQFCNIFIPVIIYFICNTVIEIRHYYILHVITFGLNQLFPHLNKIIKSMHLYSIVKNIIVVKTNVTDIKIWTKPLRS
jgi:hypothetical protein